MNLNIKKISRDFPEFEKQLTELVSLYKQLKTKRKIIAPPHPTYNKTQDLYHYLSHYINIIHLKLTHQLNLLILGIKAENPEIATIVRSCIETIGALAYIVQEATRKKSQPETVWEILNIATMGENKKTMSKKTLFKNASQTFHTADYVRAVNKILDTELKAIGSKNVDHILERYDFFSEFTHPNYLALQTYWYVESDKLHYNRKISCMRKDELADILFTITPLILVYVLVLRKAEALEKEFASLR